MITIIIEKGIPLPKKNRRNDVIYPFDKMEIGDSFFVPLKEGKKITSLYTQIINSGKSFRMRHQNDWKFSTKAIDETGVRVWRIK